MGRLGKIMNRLKPAREPLQAGDSWRADKPGANARGYTYRWQVERMAYLLAHPLCVHCQELGCITESCVVDHAIPHKGNQALFWNRDNWQALCRSCHASWKQAMEHKI